jgi:transposase
LPGMPRPRLPAAAASGGARQVSLTKAIAAQLIEAFGIGPDDAAELLVAAGDNTDQIRSEAAFAKRCRSALSLPRRSRPTATG